MVPEAYLERCEAGAGAGDRKPSVNSWGEDWDSDEEEHRWWWMRCYGGEPSLTSQV